MVDASSGAGRLHRRRLRVIVDVVVVREGAERGNRGGDVAGRGDRRGRARRLLEPREHVERVVASLAEIIRLIRRRAAVHRRRRLRVVILIRQSGETRAGSRDGARVEGEPVRRRAAAAHPDATPVVILIRQRGETRHRCRHRAGATPTGAAVTAPGLTPDTETSIVASSAAIAFIASRYCPGSIVTRRGRCAVNMDPGETPSFPAEEGAADDGACADPGARASRRACRGRDRCR